RFLAVGIRRMLLYHLLQDIVVILRRLDGWSSKLLVPIPADMGSAIRNRQIAPAPPDAPQLAVFIKIGLVTRRRLFFVVRSVFIYEWLQIHNFPLCLPLRNRGIIHRRNHFWIVAGYEHQV